MNKDTAMTVLLEALANPAKATDSIGRVIAEILRGSHKTYKYILFTALLAKATNEDIDVLSIQAGDNSSGEFS